MNILVVAEHDNKNIKTASTITIAAANAIGGQVDILVAGHDCATVAEQSSKLSGVNSVLLNEHVAYQHHSAENLAALVASVGKNYQFILAPHNSHGKNFMPRVAALLDVAQISDVVAIQDTDTFCRPIYAGNATATVKSTDLIKVITIRTTAFDSVANGPEVAPIKRIDDVFDLQLVEFINESTATSDRPDLTVAGTVISGGRGMQNGENFKLLEGIADKLNAAIGASRAAVDSGFVPNDMQVGQTGKIVAPDLYIAVGISGAIQHLAGMKDSKIIVAINKDADAPIFQIADYGLVADLFVALPELESKL